MSEVIDETPVDETPTPEDNKQDNELESLRENLAALERRAKEAERKAAALEREKLSDSERVAAEAQEARERADKAERELRKTRVEAVAASLGAVDPEAVAMFITDPPEDKKDIERAVKTLFKQKPYLEKGKGADDRDVDAGAGGDAPKDFNETIRRGFLGR